MFHYDYIEDFLTELRIFLENEPNLSAGTINKYLNRIKRILQDGYSVGDLCGAVDQLIKDYNKDGQKYDPNDSGETRAALQKVRLFVRKKILENFGKLQITYKRSYESFRPADEYLAEYVIDDGTITLRYNKGFTSSVKTEIKVIPTRDLDHLICIINRAKAKDLLADSYTAFNTEHDRISSYEYQFNDDFATESTLFKVNSKPTNDDLRRDYNNLIQKIIGQ